MRGAPVERTCFAHMIEVLLRGATPRIENARLDAARSHTRRLKDERRRLRRELEAAGIVVDSRDRIASMRELVAALKLSGTASE
jgi:hypothetical protein